MHTEETIIKSDGTPSEGLAGTVNRFATVIRLASAALIVLSIVLIFRHLPVRPAVQALEGWTASLGIWGPLAFGLIYVVAVAALIPGSSLTLAAGALFGLISGTIVASLASTTGAALAFLISRYLARDRIRILFAHYPAFQAIDKAISDGGWRIVALLRLSPAVPFNLQNYMYGLTGIRFWPCVLASWLAMLPGTFLYVYLGHIGREGLQAAAGGAERPRSLAEWAMLGVGLTTTITLTVYLTRLTRRALRLQIGIGTQVEPSRIQGEIQGSFPSAMPVLRSILLLGLALAALVFAGYLRFHPDMFQLLIENLLGPE